MVICQLPTIHHVDANDRMQAVSKSLWLSITSQVQGLTAKFDYDD